MGYGRNRMSCIGVLRHLNLNTTALNLCEFLQNVKMNLCFLAQFNHNLPSLPPK